MKLRMNSIWLCLCMGMFLVVGCGDDDTTDSDTTATVTDGDVTGDNTVSPTPDTPDADGEASLPSIAEIATEAGTFATLLTAVEAAGLTGLLADASAGPFTVFAPNDEAFAAVDSAALEALIADVPALTTVLQHHIVAGKFAATAVLGAPEHTTLAETTLAVDATATPPTIGGAAITATDLEASNGYVHVIDTVLFPPEEEAPNSDGGDLLVGAPDANTEADVEAGSTLPSIATLATDAGTFGTLLTAVETAGLTTLLADPAAGPFTVFAPNDTAFAAVDSAALEALLADVPGLTTVLQHHIVSGKFDASAVMGAAEHTSLAETTLAVDATATPPTIEGAGIIATDLEASNGYVHVIDAVIFPPEG